MIKDLVLPSPPDVPTQVDLLLRQLVSAFRKYQYFVMIIMCLQKLKSIFCDNNYDMISFIHIMLANNL